MAGRQAPDQSITPSAARRAAIMQHMALSNARFTSNIQPKSVLPHNSPLTATWQSVGPAQVSSLSYGSVTGRISSIAIDQSDSSGNTVYLGTTGGGVWKSTNAASTTSNIAFTPLTDDLSVFSISSGSSAIASLSVGAVTVQPGGTGVVLAGTGDPNDATDSYFGEGILRSADGGQSWGLIQNSAHGLYPAYSFTGNGFAGFAWSSNTSGLVVAAVSQAAEGIIVNALAQYYSIQGLYYSSDSGVTWYMASIKDGTQTVQYEGTNFGVYTGNPATSVVWNPIRQRFYAAIRYHGYYESSDGINWSRLANQPGINLTTTNCPTNPTSTGSINCPIFRGQLAVDSTTGDTFALTVDANNKDQGLWRDVCNLTSGHCASSTELFGTQLTTTPLEVGSGNSTIAQGDYNLYLAAVHSSGDTLIFAGTEDIYRCSLAAGCLFRNTTNAYSCAAAKVAPAQHAVDFIPADGPLLYFGNDGGLWRSTDGVNQQAAVCSSDDANHYQNLNSGLGPLAEVVSLAAHPSDPTQLIVGLGANGSAASYGNASSTAIWPQLSSGEGGTTAIDPTGLSNWFITTNDGISINLCTQGASCSATNFATAPDIGPAQISYDQAVNDAPYILDPALTSQLIAGTCRVWRGVATGSGWSTTNLLSPMLDGVSNTYCNGNSLIRSLGAGGTLIPNVGSQVLYAGMAGYLNGGGIKSGHLYSTTSASTANAGTAWTDLYASSVTNDTSNHGQFNPGNFDISSIAVDPHDTTGMTVYATVMGFSGNAYSVPHVYMSTTGGATWTNISSNLPNAPANAVLVDPNDATIVYVALDTGIYVTQAVSTCSTPSINCWSVFGVGLPNAPVTQLAATPASGSSVLSAGTYGRGIWQLPLASTLSATQVTLSPSSLTFSNQTTGTSSAAQTITLTNTGSTELTIYSTSISSNFSQTNNCNSAPILTNGTCTINVIFSPTTTGAISGTLSFGSNVSGGSITVSLSGEGIAAPAPIITFSPSSLSFSALTSGSTSAIQAITLTNTGNAALSISQVSLTGDFSESDNCANSTIAIGATCTLQVAFTPLASSTLTGVITVYGNVVGGTATVNLSGTGIAIGVLTSTPTTINFGSIYEGSSAVAQTFTIQNTGNAPTQITAVSISSNFTQVNNCSGATLPVNYVCSIQVIFSPTTFGSISGTITILSNASNSPLTINISGYGQGAPNVTVLYSPTSLTYSSQIVGTSSAIQNITLSMNTSGALYTPTITITGDFTQSNTCTSFVAYNYPCTIGVIFTPTATGTRTGQITITGNLTNGPITVPLTGTGLAGAQVTISPTSLAFSSQTINTSSASQSFVLQNTGSLAAVLSTPQVTGDFSISFTTCGTTLASAATCTIAVIFTPSAAGTRTGILSIANTGTSGTVSASLSGTGTTNAVVSLSPTALNFSSVNIGSTSAVQNIVVANTGQSSATLSSPSITGDYSISFNSCTTTLAPQNSCTISIAFTPTASGTRSGTLQISTPSGTQTASLTGTGLSPATDSLAPVSLTFGSQVQGTASAAQTLTLTNAGDNSLNAISAQIVGDFALVSGCGASLSGHSSCGLNVSFTPKAVGAETGTLTLTDAIRTQTVALNGTGIPPAGVSLSPSSGLSFGVIGLGQTSATQFVILTNNGGVVLSISSISIIGVGDFTIASGQNTCPTSLAVGASCTVQIVFTPLAVGTRSAQLSIADSAASSPQTISLTGTGLDFTLASSGTTTQSLSSGSQAIYLLTATPAATGFTTALALTCTGVPTNTTCTITTSPSTASLSGNVAITVLLATGVNPNNRSAILPYFLFPIFLLPACCAAFHRRQRRLPQLLLLLPFFSILVSASSCGSGGRLIPASTSGGSSGGTTVYNTPSGTYTLLLTATAAGVTHTQSLTLTVQ